MSRAFVKEDALGEDVLVTHRAPLPEGVPNLVTEAGLALLEAERDGKLAELDRLREEPEQAEATRRIAALEEELEELEERLTSAEVAVPPADGSVGVGATVSLSYLSGPQAGQRVELSVVGVDEADPLEGKVAFTAPIAAALLGATPGRSVTFQVGERSAEVELLGVRYGS